MMTRDKALEYYETFLEEVEESASAEVRQTYKAHNKAFEEYISAIQEDLFQQAFRYGYEQGLKEANR